MVLGYIWAKLMELWTQKKILSDFDPPCPTIWKVSNWQQLHLFDWLASPEPGPQWLRQQGFSHLPLLSVALCTIATGHHRCVVMSPFLPHCKPNHGWSCECVRASACPLQTAALKQVRIGVIRHMNSTGDDWWSLPDFSQVWSCSSQDYFSWIIDNCSQYLWIRAVCLFHPLCSPRVEQ